MHNYIYDLIHVLEWQNITVIIMNGQFLCVWQKVIQLLIYLSIFVKREASTIGNSTVLPSSDFVRQASSLPS